MSHFHKVFFLIKKCIICFRYGNLSSGSGVTFLRQFVNLGNRMVFTEAMRAQKYRLENKEKNSLIMAMQNLKRAKQLASGTPEAEKMRKAATLRKQLQRQREKEDCRNVTRKMASGLEKGGDSSSFSSMFYLSISSPFHAPS